MDYLPSIAAFATIISVIISLYKLFRRSKKKTQAQASVTNSPGATLVENSLKTTVVKDSPGATIGGDLNVFYLGDYTGEEHQHILEERAAQLHAGIAQETSRTGE